MPMPCASPIQDHATNPSWYVIVAATLCCETQASGLVFALCPEAAWLLQHFVILYLKASSDMTSWEKIRLRTLPSLDAKDVCQLCAGNSFFFHFHHHGDVDGGAWRGVRFEGRFSRGLLVFFVIALWAKWVWSPRHFLKGLATFSGDVGQIYTCEFQKLYAQRFLLRQRRNKVWGTADLTSNASNAHFAELLHLLWPLTAVRILTV